MATAANPFTPTPATLATPSTGGGSLTQGDALPSITTTQQQATTLPQFYQDYLTNLTTQGQTALNGMNFAGPTANQTAAFNGVQTAANAYQPGLAAANQTTTNALGLNAAGMVAPYFTQATNNSALGQANPYLTQSAASSGLNAANPYLASFSGSSDG